MKYVINTENKVAIGKGSFQFHSDLMDEIGGELLSAAHCKLNEDGTVDVFGESIGFGTKARKEDKEILEQYFKKLV